MRKAMSIDRNGVGVLASSTRLTPLSRPPWSNLVHVVADRVHQDVAREDPSFAIVVLCSWSTVDRSY